MPVQGDAAIVLEHVKKQFGQTVALDDVSLEVRAGSVHALVGQNGSGKSTLVKILTSVYQADEGRVFVSGKEMSFPWQPSHRHGIAVIHQDLGLVDSLSALENFGVGSNYGRSGIRLISRRRESALFRNYSSRLKVDIDPRSLVRDIRPSDRAMLAVMKSLRQLDEAPSQDAHVLVLDEPTVFLPEVEKERLAVLIRNLTDSGAAILLINHDLSQVFGLADTVSVLRDGRIVHHGDVSELNSSSLVAHMLGRELEAFYPERHNSEFGMVALRAKGVAGGTVRNVNLELRHGEIVGLAGLAGMGQDELPYLLAGSIRPRTGSVSLIDNGGTEHIVKSRVQVADSIGMVPANRVQEGLWTGGTVVENLTIADVGGLHAKGFINPRREVKESRPELLKFKVVPPDGKKMAGELSGGNQQKVVMARWLQHGREVQILHEPCSGIDVGASFDLCRVILEASEMGAAILISSSDYLLLASLCDKVLIMRNGELIKELSRDELSQSNIANACQETEVVSQ